MGQETVRRTRVPWALLLGCILTIGLAIFFGIRRQPTEMGLIIGACAVCYFFLNIEKFAKFKAAGIEAELRTAVDEANATIEQLRAVATSIAKSSLSTSIAAPFWGGLPTSKRVVLDYSTIQALKEIGVSSSQLDDACDLWRRGMGIVFHNAVRSRMPHQVNGHTVNLDATAEQKETGKEFEGLMEFKSWTSPSSTAIHDFLLARSMITPEIEEIIKDYAHFEQTSELRRPEAFVAFSDS